VSIDCKATVRLGDVSRGGYTRGDHRACDHDLGLKEKYIPCGIVDEASGQLSITFGSSSKTSDFIVDTLEAWWAALDTHEQVAMARLQIKMDNGPESSGKRTQFLQRMVGFCDAIGKPIQLLYYPPYHSKYNPIERCWGSARAWGRGQSCFIRWGETETGASLLISKAQTNAEKSLIQSRVKYNILCGEAIRKEAKRCEPCGPRITRYSEATMSFLHTWAIPWLSPIAGGCFMGATPRGRQGSPALTLLHMSDGPRVLFGRRCCGRSAGPPYVSALPISAQRVA